MIKWTTLTKAASALEKYAYGRGPHRRTATRIQDCFNKCKRNAKRREIDWTLTPEHYASIWRDDCVLCSATFGTAHDKEPRWNSRSLDRIDASKPYCNGNVRFTCYGCNVSIGLQNIAAARRLERVRAPCL